MTARSVEILYFEGCPNVDTTIDRIRTARAEARLPAAGAVMIPVTTEEEARARRFLGSPTVRVDGLDVEVRARERTDFALQCRVYESSGRLECAPPVDWIRAALLGETPAPTGNPVAPAAAHDCCADRRKT